MKRTKIVCTLGPVSDKKSVLKKMILAGMDCARINFSHGTYKEHAILIKFIREVARKLDRPVAFMADLQGPRIRVGVLSAKGINLIEGKEVILYCEKVSKKTYIKKNQIAGIPITYQNLYKEVSAKDKILFDEGLIQLKVLKVQNQEIYAKVLVGGKLSSHKGINIPKSGLKIPAITKKDKEDLEFAIKNDVDWVAVSFVKHKDDILNLKKIIKKLEKKYKIKRSAKVIAKIEKHEAVENFDQILEAADGIMVARGDLGIETSLQKVPLIQKRIIEKCLEKAKPVITATQMLLSMVENPKPTRAEVSDVANAVIDHTDAVMLSQETAVGKYPSQTVKIMSEIIKDTEKSSYDDMILKKYYKKIVPIDTAISSSVSSLSRDIKTKAILVATISGYTAQMISRQRPELPIIVTAESEKVRRQLALSWGVIPYVMPKCKNVDELINKAVKLSIRKKIIKKGDKIIIIGGQPVGKIGNVNLIKIHEVK